MVIRRDHAHDDDDDDFEQDWCNPSVPEHVQCRCNYLYGPILFLFKEDNERRYKDEAEWRRRQEEDEARSRSWWLQRRYGKIPDKL